MFVAYANINEKTIWLSIPRCEDNGVDILIQQRTSNFCLSSVYVLSSNVPMFEGSSVVAITVLPDELSVFNSFVQRTLWEVGWVVNSSLLRCE